MTGILPVFGEVDRGFYLRLPDDIPDSIRGLANDIRRRGRSDADRVELLDAYFQKGNYRYSMDGLPTGPHALELFLFEKKMGNCEFFASAFALLLRGAGIPARLVGGYLGGDFNEFGGYYLISEDMAHVWVEAYITGKGWVRIDPSSYAQNAGAIWDVPHKRGRLAGWRQAMDSFSHTWNRTVITYDFESQAEAARGAGKRLQGLGTRKSLHKSMRLLLVMVGVAGFVLLVGRRKRLFPSREERLLRSFYHHLEQDCGMKPERGRQGLFELAASSGNGRVRAFVDIYAGAVYRERRLSDDEYGELKRMLRERF
jgi:hypothetical protein